MTLIKKWEGIYKETVNSFLNHFIREIITHNTTDTLKHISQSKIQLTLGIRNGIIKCKHK